VTAAIKAGWLGTGLDDSVLFVDDAAINEVIPVAERNAALRAAFAELSPALAALGEGEEKIDIRGGEPGA
jgi:hypothetical protein